MFIIHGAYHFWPKRVAFRDDYCLSCQTPRRSIAFRTFDVGHVFWIPILPVGFWKHWKCTACGRDPHVNPRTRRSFKWAGLIVLIGASVMLWEIPSDADFGAVGWILRIAAPAAAILLSCTCSVRRMNHPYGRDSRRSLPQRIWSARSARPL